MLATSAVLCDACQKAITRGGLVVISQDRPAPVAVLVVHDGCHTSAIVEMFVTTYRTQPLAVYLTRVLAQLEP